MWVRRARRARRRNPQFRGRRRRPTKWPTRWCWWLPWRPRQPLAVPDREDPPGGGAATLAHQGAGYLGQVAEGGGAEAELPSAEEVRVERLQQELQVAQQAAVEAKRGEVGDVSAAGAAERSARAVGADAAPSRRAPKAARVATTG
ncbi:hypothetical protein (Partial), partial [Ectocarpus siliculosus]